MHCAIVFKILHKISVLSFKGTLLGLATNYVKATLLKIYIEFKVSKIKINHAKKFVQKSKLTMQVINFGLNFIS